MFISMFRNLFLTPRPRHARARPILERLEDRTVPSAGLLSWWSGDDTPVDIPGHNDGTLNGGAGYTAGVVKDAFQFNGVDGYFSAPTNRLPTGNGDRTIDLWVKIDAVVAERAFFAGYGAFGTANGAYALGALGSRLLFTQWGQAIFGPSLDTGTWYNVAVTNVGNSITLYLGRVDNGWARPVAWATAIGS
jgi:concanavalin A-like lectin/glucanase superfamily protein